MASYLNRKKEDLVQSKFLGIIFLHKIFCLKNFKDQDSSKFTGGLDSVKYGKLFYTHRV